MKVLILSPSSGRVILPVEERRQSLFVPKFVIPDSIKNSFSAGVKIDRGLSVGILALFALRILCIIRWSLRNQNACNRHPVVDFKVFFFVLRGPLTDLAYEFIFPSHRGRIVTPIRKCRQRFLLAIFVIAQRVQHLIAFVVKKYNRLPILIGGYFTHGR